MPPPPPPRSQVSRAWGISKHGFSSSSPFSFPPFRSRKCGKLQLKGGGRRIWWRISGKRGGEPFSVSLEKPYFFFFFFFFWQCVSLFLIVSLDLLPRHFLCKCCSILSKTAPKGKKPWKRQTCGFFACLFLGNILERPCWSIWNCRSQISRFANTVWQIYCTGSIG